MNDERSEPEEGLVLRKEEVRERTAALFAKIERDDAEREQFIRNPVGVLGREVVGRELGEQVESDANRLLLSMLSNPEFRGWLEDKALELEERPTTHEQFRKDFATALVEFGDPVLVDAALRNVANGFDIVGPMAQQLITGPERTLVTSPATPSTSNQTLHSSQNFNGVAIGDPTVIEPELFRSVVDQLVNQAEQLRASGALADVERPIR
ncbi:MAG TPA: hypothetical protein VGW75_04520 [Solirubrobacteraceae bacterium]|jgi:hypothetical protein|nr:hypothetical protein [Solirubrobacteraceae bacterium]